MGGYHTTQMDGPQKSYKTDDQPREEMTGDFMKRELLISKILIFAAPAVCATSAGVCLDAFLSQQGLSDFSILWASNVLLGITVGSLVFQYKLRLKAKQQILEERIETLSEVNQHIRSVLTSLTLYGTQSGSGDAELLSELLRRVETNLVDLFTRMLFDQSVPQSVLKVVRNTRIIRSLSRTSENYAAGENL